MKLIVGLGNPGIEYQFTPHNAGFLVLDRIAERCHATIDRRRWRSLTGKVTIAGEDAVLAKPETFMNLSGMAVREMLADHDIDPARDLIVIHDEMDFPMGVMRIRERGSSAGHNGVESIIGAVGSPEFVRVRLGVAPDHAVKDGARYVLSQFKKSQYAAVDEMLERAAEAVNVIVKEGAAVAMNRFNRKPEPEEGEASGKNAG